MSTDRIVYRDLPSPLGPMIAGATERGVCFLEWHDRGGVKRIIERIERRYNRAVRPGDNKHLKKLATELAGYFAGSLSKFTVDRDVTGTPFELLTWKQLLKIPYGKTKSYGDVAAMLGKPGASRAVGRANGANYLAIVIPCHRVIDSAGRLHGYGGGLHRKKYLLDLEAGKIPLLPE